jgi:hypothetical protein
LIGLNKERFSKPKLVNSIDQNVLGGHKIRPLVKIAYNSYFDSEFVKNKDGTYDHPNDTVPVSLLRRYFTAMKSGSKINAVIDHNIWEYILCKIEYTMDAISSGKINFQKFFKWNIESATQDNLYGLSKECAEWIYGSPDKEFTIMKSVLVRVEFGHRLMRFFSVEEDKTMLFASQLFIDTHLDLMVHVVRSGVFTNEGLLDNYKSEVDIQSSFTKYYPHDSRFAYCGDAPDFTTCADLGNIWFDIRPRIRNLISYIIHIFCSKTLKHKCSKRNFLRILIKKYVDDFPVLNEIYKMIIEISLMGNYPHANFRTNFVKRLEIRQEFHHVRQFDDNQTFHKWMKANEEMIVCITKEFHMYTVVAMYALDIRMEETKNWKSIKMICVKSMDMIRSMISNFKLNSNVFNGVVPSFTEEDAVFQLTLRIKDRLAVLEQKMSVLLDKLKKCNFLNLMLSYIEKFYQSVIVDKKSTVYIGSESVLSQEVVQGIETVATYVSLKYNNFVPTRYLKCFGISEQSYEEIRDFYYRYEALNTPDNSVKAVLENIYQRSKEDFFIIRTYFQGIKKCRSVEVFPFTMEQYESAMYSLKVKRMVEPWMPLTEEHTRYYFCVVCNKWACPIVDPNCLSSVVNIFSLGKEKVSRDPYTKQLFCGKQITSITIKNTIETDVYFFEGEIDDEGLAKQIRTHKSSVNCTTVPLCWVQFFGKIIRIGGKGWAACSICTQPTVFEGAKFGANGFTCCFHENPPTKKRKFAVAADTKSTDPLIKARNQVGFDYKLEAKIYCVYCGKLAQENSQIIKTVDKNNEYGEAILCGHDYELVKDSINVDNILFKENLFAQLNEARTKHASIPAKKQRRKKIDR